MIKKPFLFIFVSLLILATSVGAASAQSSKEAEGQAAELAGKLREALTHYVAAFQSVLEGSADDQRLRETIIKLVQKLSPPPAIPEEARRFSVRGQIAIKEAKSRADFEEAAKEFGRALRVAPWWADGYINQGVALEKAGKYNEAIRSLKFYLLAAPGAPDAEKIKEQIYALEYRQEKAQKDAAAQREVEEQPRRAQEAYQRNLGFLAGRWTGTETTHFELISNCRGNCTRTDAIAVDIEIAGKKITIKQTGGWVDLIGNIAGSDPASIQWEIARSNSYVGEPVSIFVSPSRIYYKLPVYQEGRPDIGRPGPGRVDGYFEIDLRK